MFTHFTILIVICLVSLFYEKQLKTNKLKCLENGGTSSDYKGSMIPWLIAFGYVAILAGMRSGMNDTSVYIHAFNETKGSWGSIQDCFDDDIKYIAWKILMNLFKIFVSSNYHDFFLFIAVLEAIIFSYVLKKETISFFDSLYFFFCSTLYYNNFSMMRQWLAISITFLGYKFLKEENFIKYGIVCLVAGLFHPSAFILIPLYFVVVGKAWTKKQNIIIGLFVVLIMFLNPILSSMSESMEGTTYDYVIETMNSHQGSSIIRAFIALVPVSLAFIYRDKITDPMINVCVNCSLINYLLNVLASFTSGLYVIRLSNYVGVYNLILYPYLLNMALDNKNKNMIKIAFYCIYMIFFIYQTSKMGAWGYKSDVLTFLSNY